MCVVTEALGSQGHFWEDPLTGNCYACVVTEYVLKLQSMHSRSSVCASSVSHTHSKALLSLESISTIDTAVLTRCLSALTYPTPK